MKIKSIILVALLAPYLSVNAQTKPAAVQANLARPKLVVGIVVDQMRWDYLYRYYNRYQAGGFKRMLNEGFSCENTNIDYIPTVTAIGHSTLYTGSVPAIHGIAGNDFIIQATGKSMYCTEDSTVKTLGSTSDAGEMSPRNLLTSTVTDELRLATNFRSKVIGIALKDRGGILPAGHTANAAYWFDDVSGNWISSTYYMKDLPNWVKDFNNQKLPEKYLSQDWNTLYPIASYVQSTADNTAYEGKFPGTETPTFPVKLSAFPRKNLGAIRTTPFGNSLTLDLALAAIKNENLGKGTVTDFLAVSFSSTDYVGHQFGVNSIEVEDTYLRLDQDLAKFFTYLDTQVGKGNYTVFLSADHGAAHNPKFLTDHEIPAGLWAGGKVQAELNAMLEAKYGQKNLVISLGNYQVNFNNKVIASSKLDEKAMISDCITLLEHRDDIAYAVNMKEVANSNVPEILRNRIINGYNPERSGAIQIILKPGWFSGSGTTGTSHGTWNAYDAHIPFVLMGWGIKHGASNNPVNMTDVSATIAALLHIQAPNGSIGKPVTEALK